MDDYVLTLVFSNFVLSKIHEFMVDYLDATPEEICTAKIERFKDKKTGELKDSNRTLILMKKSLFIRAVEAGLDLPQPNLDFRINEFLLNERSFPMEGFSSNFYMLIPKNLSTYEVEHFIRDKMRYFVNFGMLEENDYNIKIPMVSRLTGEHRGFAALNFSEKVNVKTRAQIRLLMHDSPLYFTNTKEVCHLPVYWAKKYTLPEIPTEGFKILKR